MPSDMTDHLKRDVVRVGIVMWATGFGAMAGTIIPSTLSDSLGRKPVIVLAVCMLVAPLGGNVRVGLEDSLFIGRGSWPRRTPNRWRRSYAS